MSLNYLGIIIPRKAFDKVPHYQLLAKLKQLQLHPIIMTWLHSYLYRREQFVYSF